ncbi:hypothetical protein C8A05DRAFT_47623 [Staphylotrichum tortipilum]|uniref:UBZ4-type domain-containing protein n=1 Tax=Staphylotrichum tortipilum TaxID=2831512 RepID=A0AAN6MCP8_9PEZI|nr:hypothetical protein C8A05DRAFT_47623 [Staphylotrichum longicolle]
MARVPTAREVIPGALVNIVLKADQPTGRTVQGAVGQLLTKGNHPRGIKVQLTDGRVGRVQSMVGAPAASSAHSQAESITEMAAQMVAQSGARHGGRVGEGDTSNWGGRSGRFQDIRTMRGSVGLPPPTPTIGLDAYIKPAKKRGKAKSAAAGTAGTATADEASPAAERAGQAGSEMEESTCPVCGDFRGDAAALTHHVQSHFDD